MRTPIILLLVLLPIAAAAQEDSSKYLALKEIELSAKSRSSSRHLLHFFKANMGYTLEDMMARLPEISFIRRGSYGMEPTLRSLNGGQINVMIDGMRIYGACTDKMDPATIYVEPTNLDNIQLATGNDAFLQGSSVGGSINMKMAEPRFSDNPTSVTVNTGYQSAARAFIGTMNFSHQTGNLAMLASATYRKANDYRAGGGEIVNHSAYEKMNYSLAIKYRLSQTLSVKADLIGDDGWNIGYPALPMDVGYASARIGALTLQSNDQTKALRSWQAKIYANEIRHYMDDTHRPDVPMHMDMPGKSSTAGMFVEGDWKLPKKHSLQTKLDLSSTYQEASMTMYAPGEQPMYMLTWPDNRKEQAGAGAIWSMKADSNWTISSSIRADLVRYRLLSDIAKQEVAILGGPDSRNDILLSGTIGVTRRLGKTIQLNGSMQWGERAPTGSELYGFYLFNRQDGFDYLGNPSLYKERAWNGEISVSRNSAHAKLRLALFYDHINNYIIGEVDNDLSAMTPGANGVKSYINLPYATIAGLEATAQLHLNSRLQLVSTLKYNRGADHLGNALPMISPLKNITSLRMNLGNAFAQFEYEGSAAQHRFDEDYGEDATAAYSLFHIRMNFPFTVFRKSSVLQAGVENIFDRNYHDHLDWGNIPRPGRNIYIQLKLSL